jgi:hypothetical protein
VLQVRAHNNSDSTVFVYMYVDGQEVALYAAEPHAYCTFSDVAVASNPKERKELLFSLPRRVTQAEKKCAGTTYITPTTASLKAHNQVLTAVVVAMHVSLLNVNYFHLYSDVCI